MIDRRELRRLWDEDFALRLQAEGTESPTFQRIVSDVAALTLPGARFGPEGSASGVTVDGSGIFGERAERCESTAGLTGAARPAGLVFAEIRLFNVKEWHDPSYHGTSRRAGGITVNRRRETDVFRGLFMAFDLDAAVRGTTFVDPHRAGPAIADRDALERVATGDPAFERAFRVTGSDPDEARELLLPSVRAGLLRLAEVVQRPLHVSIAQRRVCIAIELGPSLFEAGQRADYDRLAEIAGLFDLVELAAAALPIGVALPGAHRPASASVEDAPGRPATSRTRLTRRGDTLSVVYTKATSPLLLALSGLGAPLLAWGWLLALRAVLETTGDNSGALAVMIPLAVGTLLWFYAAQQWWAPVRRVDVESGELKVARGLLGKSSVPAASVRSLSVRKGVLHGDDLALSPPLSGAELRWLLYEIGQALPEAARE